VSREERRRLAEEVRGLREGLEADLEAGVAWVPWDAPERPAAKGVPPAAKERALAAVAAEVAACTLCRLCEGRTNTVPGEGDPASAVMFVGEGPGEQEDLSGRPFVGRAGQLLRRMITEELGLDPAAVFIANIVKCRPPGNRAPLPDEAAACLPFLRRQVAAVRPRVIVTLGNPSTQALLQTKEGITKLHGKAVVRGGFTFFPTFHPSYLLRNPPAEPDGRADFRAVKALLAR
jgi:uracil-DNA glycosylase family 4